ncbi:MAG: MATE family efflux transporter [Velocimicrobium sp.]
MTKQAIDRNFFKYVFSSMVTMLLQSLYSIIDGLFVSNLVGDFGLSAINVVWPMLAVIIATGTGIGCGGSVIMSTMQGARKPKESNRARANVIMLLFIFSIIMTVLFLLLLSPFLTLMGAKGNIYTYATIYGKIMIGGSFIQIFSTGLTPLLRNDNQAVTAMNIMVSGLVCNLCLNYVFMNVFSWGIQGSAAASLLSQALTVIACFVVLLGNKKNPIRLNQFVPDKNFVNKIIRTGISPFGISLTPSLIIMYHNMQCIRYGGAIGIGVFSLITSTVGSYRIILIGIAEGIQPLASFASGANDYQAIRKIRNKAIFTAISASVILFLFTIITAKYYAKMYGFTGDMAKASYGAILLSATQLIFTGLVRVSNSFFYAVGKEKYSLFMIYFDPLVMMPVLIIILPLLFGLNGIWITMTISQAILNVIAIFMYWKHEKELRQLETAQETATNSLQLVKLISNN